LGLALAVTLVTAAAAWAGPAPGSPDAPVRNHDGVLHLSWHAPYGSTGATLTLAPHCGTPHPDTLWLTIEVPDAIDHLYGFDTLLMFHAISGDTLTPYWHFGGGESNPNNIRVEWPDSHWPTMNPFWYQNFGAADYRHAAEAGALDMTFAVNADSALRVAAGSRFAVARVLFPAIPDSDTTTCHHPVCVEWRSAMLGVAIHGHNLTGTDVGGTRFVSFATDQWSVCDPFLPSRAPRSWLPAGVATPR
jgi:hypothetical protein